jgi:hypothetical protein
MIRIQGIPVVAERLQKAHRPVRPDAGQPGAGALRPPTHQLATKFRAA